MDNLQEIKNFISGAKNIYIIPNNEEPESGASALALFYTLKELGKNVNVILENLPERIRFLTPSLDFISFPKNFVISVPKTLANISQIYYEKNEENLKIHLTIEKGNLKKDDISFYYSETKPDIIITIGISDFKKYMLDKLNSFGFLLNSPILNIDNKENNSNFGNINITENCSLAEKITGILRTIDESLIKKEVASCLLTELILFSDDLKNEKTTPETLEIAAFLIKKGAERVKIAKKLFAIENI